MDEQINKDDTDNHEHPFTTEGRNQLYDACKHLTTLNSGTIDRHIKNFTALSVVGVL